MGAGRAAGEIAHGHARDPGGECTRPPGLCELEILSGPAIRHGFISPSTYMSGVMAMRPEPYAVRLMLACQHHFNPLHVYCRLVERGLSRRVALWMARVYGVVIWSWAGAMSVMVARIIKKA